MLGAPVGSGSADTATGDCLLGEAGAAVAGIATGATVSLPERGWIRAWSSGAPGVNLSRGLLRGIAGFAPRLRSGCVRPLARPLGLCRGCSSPTQLTQEEARGESGAQRGRAQGQRGGQREPGYRLGHGAGGRQRQITCAGATKARVGCAGRLGSTSSLPCLRSVASGIIWRPYSLTTSSAREGQAPSGGRMWNCAGTGSGTRI